jgi:hypothetical protein
MRTSLHCFRRPSTSKRAKAVFSTVSVVRMACATCWKWSNSGAQGCGQGGQRGDQLFGRQRDADDAGGGGKDLFGWAAEDFLRGGAGGAGGGQAGWPAAQLALPALMATTRTRPPVARRCSLSTMSGRGDDAVGGEGGGGAGRRIGHDEGKVGAAALLEAGLGGAKAEAAGMRNWDASDMVVQPI